MSSARNFKIVDGRLVPMLMTACPDCAGDGFIYQAVATNVKRVDCERCAGCGEIEADDE